MGWQSQEVTCLSLPIDRPSMSVTGTTNIELKLSQSNALLLKPGAIGCLGPKPDAIK